MKFSLAGIQDIRYSLKATISTTIVVALVCYFFYHAISGERGGLAYIQLSQQVKKYHQELDQVRAQRIDIEHKIHKIQPESLDLDMLDEQARMQLGYIAPDELVYFISW